MCFFHLASIQQGQHVSRSSRFKVNKVLISLAPSMSFPNYPVTGGEAEHGGDGADGSVLE